VKLKTELGEFKESPIFQIWEVDETGKKKDRRPLISFGEKKAKAILDSLDSLRHFANGDLDKIHYEEEELDL